jgi:hypothetical protein
MKTNYIALLEDECLDGVVGGRFGQRDGPFDLNDGVVVLDQTGMRMPKGSQAALMAHFFPDYVPPPPIEEAS